MTKILEEIEINGIAYIPKEQSNIEQIEIMAELKVIKSTVLQIQFEQNRIREDEMKKITGGFKNNCARPFKAFEVQSQVNQIRK